MSETWSSEERERLRQVVRQKAGTVKFDLTQGDVVEGLHHFWSGGWIDLAKHTSLKRGNVPFFRERFQAQYAEDIR